MSHIYTGQDPESPPPVITGQGAWPDIQVPDDSDYRDAQSAGVGLEGLADRTVWLRRRLHLLNQTGTINQIVPVGLGSTISIWTTPIAPYLIEGATVRLTGTATASGNPANLQFDLAINGVGLIVGLTSAWGGLTYTVNGTGTNEVIWGFPSGEWGPLLDGTLLNNRRDSVGAVSESGRLLVLAPAVNGFMNKPLTLQVRHGSLSPLTLNIPYEIRILGRMLL